MLRLEGGAGADSDPRARADLDRWLQSITHKVTMVKLIDLDPSPARLRAALHQHPSTRSGRKYSESDPAGTARRLEADALNELHLFLSYAYRRGHHDMLIYPYRPRAHRPAPRRTPPLPPDR